MATVHPLQHFLDDATIGPEVLALRPDYRVLLMVVSNLPTGPSDSISEAMLQEAESSAKTAMAATPVNDLPHVAAWREAYKSFGAKPNRTRNSLEALLRRVDKSGLPRVNRLTDIYNAISVKHQIPLGGEDLDHYAGPPSLVRATGEETFETAADGKPVVEHPEKGEVIWSDPKGVTCRYWNWRQCKRTALSDASKNVLFIFDALKPCDDEKLEIAAKELEQALKGSGEGEWGSVETKWKIIGAGRT